MFKYSTFFAIPKAIFCISSFVISGKYIFWNLDKNSGPNSCLFPAKAPLLGFCVATKAKFGCLLNFKRHLPFVSTLKKPLSKDCCIH